MASTAVGLTGEHRLDRSVAPVADPALEAALERDHLGPGAEADALHAAANDDMTDHEVAMCLRFAAHPRSRVSFQRAPLQADGAQRFKRRSCRSGIFQSRAASITTVM